MEAPTEKILFVDDESNVLEGIQRQLRKQFQIETALGPEKGLATVESQGPYAVIVSDMRMPGMNGVEFFTQLQLRNTDSVRMMLTGNADMQTAIDAVNDGHIFRFLTKPCPSESLTKALEAGLQQYRLIQGEKELLEQTLRGSIEALTDILALVNPEAFGRSSRVTRYVKNMATYLEVPEIWRCEMSAMLSQIGCVILPDGVLKKVYAGEPLEAEESQLYAQHPFIASDLLGKIPRMKDMSTIIAFQEKHFDGTGPPHENCEGEAIPMGSRLLKVALDFDALDTAGMDKTQAFDELVERTGWYDPSVLKALKLTCATEMGYEEKSLKVRELHEHMILAEELRGTKGAILLAKGQGVTKTLISRLENSLHAGQVQEPIKVLVPISKIMEPV